MRRVCHTRSLKNARYLQRVAPELIPEEEPPEGFSTLVPSDILLRLDQMLQEEADQPGLKDAIKRGVPKPQTSPSKPLFSGTVFVVQASFNSPGGPFMVSEADTKTAVEYLGLAANPISRYASQYGPNLLAVSNKSIEFQTTLTEPRFNDHMLSEWADQIAAENSFSKNSCLVFLNPLGALNVDADPAQGVMGYHSVSPSKLPYAFVNVTGEKLTVDDKNDYFALALSHEVAEVTVDPRADGSNPECCDPCGPNCPPSWRDYFGTDSKYMETADSFPPPFGYNFFINAIVKPLSATQCPAPLRACSYPPP